MIIKFPIKEWGIYYTSDATDICLLEQIVDKDILKRIRKFWLR